MMGKALEITSPAFTDGGKISKKHTGFGENSSPELELHGLEGGASLAVTLDDLDIPMIKEYNHWLIWNLPVAPVIPSCCGESCPEGAVQGVGYGKNRYAGPRQPFFVRSRHRYLFRVYVLDAVLSLPASARKAELLKAMEGHILQSGSITCTYKRGEE